MFALLFPFFRLSVIWWLSKFCRQYCPLERQSSKLRQLEGPGVFNQNLVSKIEDLIESLSDFKESDHITLTISIKMSILNVRNDHKCLFSLKNLWKRTKNVWSNWKNNVIDLFLILMEKYIESLKLYWADSENSVYFNVNQ